MFFERDDLRPLLFAEDLSPKPAWRAVKEVFAAHLPSPNRLDPKDAEEPTKLASAGRLAILARLVVGLRDSVNRILRTHAQGLASAGNGGKDGSGKPV